MFRRRVLLLCYLVQVPFSSLIATKGIRFSLGADCRIIFARSIDCSKTCANRLWKCRRLLLLTLIRSRKRRATASRFLFPGSFFLFPILSFFFAFVSWSCFRSGSLLSLHKHLMLQFVFAVSELFLPPAMLLMMTLVRGREIVLKGT